MIQIDSWEAHKCIYRALWWPMRTRRERNIWRYGYLIGAITGAFNMWRIMRRDLTTDANLQDIDDATYEANEKFPTSSRRAVREDGSTFPVMHSSSCPCSRSRAGWAWCDPTCVAYKYRAAALAQGSRDA